MCIKLLKVMGILSMSKLCALYLRTVSLKWSLWYGSDKLMLIAVLLLSSNISSCVAHHNRREQYNYEGRFIGQDEAKAIALDTNTRLAKIPCNFTTKTNCIYVQHQKLTLTTHNSPHSNPQRSNEIVVSWVTNSDNINKTEYIIGMETNESNRNRNNVRDKKRSNLFDVNWIFELLACMMLASAFEVCLLLLRNLRNIGLTFFGIWSALVVRLQKLCKSCSATSLNKSDQQQRKRNVAVGEKRTLSYIFAILTWRATQTAKCSGTSSHTTLRDDSTNNVMSYGHVTRMGDLLLLILFTHVYYQRQRLEKGLSGDEEDLSDDSRENGQNKNYYQQFYDKQKNSNCNAEPLNKHSLNYKRCSHFCGNTYQQISSLQECKLSQSKVTPVTSYVPKIPYLTYCNGMVWYTCCFCQYSYRTCCFCCCTCRHWSQCCYLYTPLCNTIYCCCFLKFLKSLHEVNCYHLCCWQDVCNLGILNSHPAYHCCCYFYCQRASTYCCVCNTLTNKKTTKSLNFLLQSKIRFSPLVASSQYGVWKLKSSYKTYSLFCLIDGLHMLVNNQKLCDINLDIFTSILLQYLLTLKNYQSVLKWKRLQVAVVIMALIVARSTSRPNYDYQNCYNSLLNKCKLFAKHKQNKKRRRRRRRHQHCKAYRPHHYFNTTPIQCMKRLKLKKLNKQILNKLNKKLAKPQTSKTAVNEHSLVASSSKTSMVRSIRRLRGSKPNIVWLLIGLIWFEGPKIVNCNVIINYQNQQQHEQQHQQQQQQQTGNSHKETTTNTVNSNFEYKTENFNQIKTKNNNNSNNSNSSSNKSKNKSKNTGSSNSNNSNGNDTNNNNRNTNNSNINLSVNVIPIINTIHLKHYCNSNYYQKVIRSSQRVQRALKTHPNSDISVTSSASQNYNSLNNGLDSKTDEMATTTLSQNTDEENHVQSDLMRLESIKHQILFKLGLTRKPNVSHPLPKQFIWDTIYRADGIKSFHELANNYQDNVLPHQSYPYWTSTFAKDSNVQSHNPKVPYDTEDEMYNIKRSMGSVGILQKKYGKKLHQTKTSLYNDINFYNGVTAIPKNQFLYTSNRNNISHTNKTINNFTIFKQSKHQQQYHKYPQHSTTATTQQQLQQNRRQHEQINQYTNNNNKNHIHNYDYDNNNNKNYNNNNNNNNDNNVNTSNNKNNNNNIIVVQKQIRDNNKNIEQVKKFTYLTDINSSGDSLNSVKYYSIDSDNNSIVRKEKLQNVRYDKTIDNYDNSDDSANIGGDVNEDMDIETEVNSGANIDPDLYTRSHNHNFNRHDNYLPKFDAIDENDEFFGSTQEIITFAEKGKMYKNHRLVEFSHQNTGKSKQKLHVRNAEIHIRIEKISRSKSGTGSGIKRKRLKIWIFQLVENNYTYKGFDHIAQFCASFEVDTTRLGWKKFDITTTVKEWYSRREGEKLRLLIDCTGCGKTFAVHLFNTNSERSKTRERRIAEKRKNSNINEISSNNFYNLTNYTNYQYNQTILIPGTNDVGEENNAEVPNPEEEEMLNSSRPFLVLHTETRRQRRVRRRAINCNGALHGQCCKESFYVSFKALGWDDWIIAPRGYFANYCRGDCTGPYRTPDTFQTFHAHFIEEYRKMGLLNGMQPCCAPIKFSSMSLIYYGDEGIIKRDLPKMVVDECGCP